MHSLNSGTYLWAYAEQERNKKWSAPSKEAGERHLYSWYCRSVEAWEIEGGRKGKQPHHPPFADYAALTLEGVTWVFPEDLRRELMGLYPRHSYSRVWMKLGTSYWMGEKMQAPAHART